MAIPHPCFQPCWPRTDGPDGRLDLPFRKAWEALGPDPEDLDLQGFLYFGPPVAEKYGDEDPAVVAKRLYPEAGEYHADLYPADATEDVSEANQQSAPPAPLAFGLPHPDVPF